MMSQGQQRSNWTAFTSSNRQNIYKKKVVFNILNALNLVLITHELHILN